MKISLNGLRAFYREEANFCQCGSVKSECHLIIRRVPQGWVLGPTLFNIHMDGITDTCKESKVELYADDTEIT